ncbi:hypothetical protein ACJIZ3_005025 [Penstemon smallii]|uniref:RING-type domain-containing protein n=1 Tax=Penstemon smallii TaxID=265156 RepID=A0ABD3S3R5_9LAMI
MGCGKSPDLDAPVEGKTELDLTIKASEVSDDGQTTLGDHIFGADLMSFPSPDYDYFPWNDITETFQSYPRECENEKKSLVGYVNLNDLADTNTDAKLKVSKYHRESEMPYPEVSMSEMFHQIDVNNTVTADCLMNTTLSSTNYSKSEAHLNFMPWRGDAAAGFPVKAQGSKAKTSSISRLQMGEYFSSSGCSTSMLSGAYNFDGRGFKSDSNIVPPQFGSPGKDDGSFLTLGIGGGTEINSNSKFSTREIASKLAEAVSSHSDNSFVGYSPKNTSSFTQLTGRARRTQTYAGGLPNSACNMVGWMNTSTEGGLVRDASAQLNSVPFPSLQQYPQADIQTNFSANYDKFCFDVTPSSLPFGSTYISHPDRVNSPLLWSEPVKQTCIASQTISNQQKDSYIGIATNVSSESSTNSLSDGNRGISTRQAQLGNLTPPTEGTRTEVKRIGSLPTSVQPVGRLYSSHNVSSAEDLGNILLPERIRFPVPKSSSFQSAVESPFPKRLDVQSNDFATSQATTGSLHQTQKFGVVDYFQKPGPPFSVGSPPIHLPAPLRTFVSDQDQEKLVQQFSKDIQRVNSSDDPNRQKMVQQFTNDIQRVNSSDGQVIPVANLDQRPQISPIVYHESLKRQATENPPGAQLGQRRKISPQRIMHFPTPHQSQSTQAAPLPATAHIPAAPLHIKWQGFDGPPQPSGHKCLLCKRDLSFTAEGPVYQPAIPPPVAVLPCGHTFHDHCLQIIIPQDQSENPPCIPCAIGET